MPQNGIHAIAGIAARKWMPAKEWLALGLVLWNMFPDLDNQAVAYATLTKADTHGLHRTFTHSLFTVAGIVILFTMIAERTMKESRAHLLIIGDGTQKPSLIKLCNSLGISARVHFPGYISKEAGLPEVYRIASLFVIASEIEKQGIVLLEAAASGLPIVAVRATCIPEIVHHGMNGWPNLLISMG